MEIDRAWPGRSSQAPTRRRRRNAGRAWLALPPDTRAGRDALAGDEELARRAASDEELDDVVWQARGARVWLEVRVLDDRVVEPRRARQPDELVVRVEPSAARHRLGRGGRSFRR